MSTQVVQKLFHEKTIPTVTEPSIMQRTLFRRIKGYSYPAQIPSRPDVVLKCFILFKGMRSAAYDSA